MHRSTLFFVVCLALTAVIVVGYSVYTDPFERASQPASNAAHSATQGDATHDFSDIIPVYSQNCARCHGVTGQGQPGIPPLKGTNLSDQEMTMLIRNGKGEMPGFPQLSDEQIARLISLIRHL